MHVLFLSTRSPYPLVGGHSLRTFHLLREAARRHRVTFLTFVQHEEEWDGLPVLREFCQEVVALPVPLNRNRSLMYAHLVANVFAGHPFVALKYNVPAMHAAVRKVRDAGPVDLLHLDMLPLAVYGHDAGDTPVVQVNHNVEHVLLERRAEASRGIPRIFWKEQAFRLRLFEARAIRQATRTIAVSDVDADILRALAPGSEVRAVPNGVDLEFFQPSPESPDADELVFVGAMTHYPNVDSVHYFVRRVWPRIRAVRPQARLTVIGVHPPRDIMDLGRQPGIKVTGWVPDIRPAVHKAAVYVVPLRIGGGTRLKILDAMAMGKAIISTTVGCEGLEVTNGRDILVADDPEEFARLTLDLMADPQRCSALGEAARQTVSDRYGWERLGALQEGVYQEAACGRAERP